MFVVDVMHDVELGDWKALFIHLLRILDSVNANLLVELDRRYASPFTCQTRLPNAGRSQVTEKCRPLAMVPFESSRRIPPK